jgi:hypothetical protein
MGDMVVIELGRPLFPCAHVISVSLNGDRECMLTMRADSG